MQDSGERRWTRRRFLKAAAALAAGGATAGTTLALGAARRSAESASPPSLTTFGGRRQFHSRPDLVPPRVTVSSNGDVGDGLLFLTPNNGAQADGPMIIDNDGDLVWFRPDSGMQAANLQVARYQGRQVLTWWEGTTNGGIGTGEFVIADTSYLEVARVRAASGRQADLHEFRLTPQGSALIFADEAVPPPAGSRGGPLPWSVLDCAIQEIEIESGELLWEWHTVDHIGIDESLAAAPAATGSVYDYVHANSIDVDADGGLLVSARNTSSVYKIDRTNGEILWRLGGKRSDFALGPRAAFGFQHDARRRADGTLTLFDDETPPAHARAIVLRLDETAMTADLVRAYMHPEALTVTSQGNMQTLPNGNVFVGWGASAYCSEFGPDGALHFDANYAAGIQSYRVLREPWVGRPTGRPAIAVEAGTDRTTLVYASWNGATEVDRWDVLAGSDPGAMSAVASAPSQGFESVMVFRQTAPLVAVRAFDRTGQLLGTSALASLL